MKKNLRELGKDALAVTSATIALGAIALGANEKFGDDTEKQPEPMVRVQITDEKNPIDLANHLGVDREDFSEAVDIISDQIGGAGDMQPAEIATLPQRMVDMDRLQPMDPDSIKQITDDLDGNQIITMNGEPVWYEFKPEDPNS